MTFVKKWIIRKKRQMHADAVVREGRRLRELRAARAGIDAVAWPGDAAAFDRMIENLERRLDGRLDYIRKTA